MRRFADASLLFLSLAVLSGQALAESQPDGVAAGDPLAWPEITSQCRPWAYHWWLGSAVDRDNLARELARYRQGGLGGVHIVPIYGVQGAENRSIEYLSPQWLEMLTFAVAEAKRHGLGIDLSTGTGWCFGGPTIAPALGCRNLVIRRIDVPVDGKLPDDLQRDSVTIQAVVAQGPNGQRQQITDQLGANGKLEWTPSAGTWMLHVLGHQFTGRMVKRAAPGGAGPMINPFCAAAMHTYLERFTAAFQDPNVAKPRAMYHDSFEYDGNWSPDLPAEFAKRRGYPIEDELEALGGHGDPDRAARVRCDVSETLSDMVIEGVFPQWVEWCHARGIKTRNQAHGAPANWLDLYALADIPETEMFGHGGPDSLVSRFDEHLGGADRNPLICKFAASAAHMAGKPLVSSETGTWLAEHFCETFEELKCEIDLLFLAGINHVFYHGCVYSPDDAAWPGWLFYASTQMNPRNPLWREAPALNEYIARCQSILQSGKPDHDLLLYWPIHDAWSRGVGNMSVHNKKALDGPLGQVASILWARGWSFDYASDRLLMAIETSHGDIAGPNGVKWRAVVVPECQQIPHTTLAKLLDLADQGATVIFPTQLPEDVPGLGQLQERRAAIQELLSALLPDPRGKTNRTAEVQPEQRSERDRRTETDGSLPPVRPDDGSPPRVASYGNGRVLVGPLEQALKASGVQREPLVDHPGVQYIRRTHGAGRHYFIVNHGLESLAGWIALATPARSAVVMDPMTGRSGVTEIRGTSETGAEVYLKVAPGHSIIVRTFEQEQIDGPLWKWPRSSEVVQQIGGPWAVEFLAGGPELPRPLEVAELKSWTAGGRPALEAFSGTARYRCTFSLTAGSPILDQAAPAHIDLGDVKHVARVRINGTDLGVLIMHPYRLPIPAGLLRADGNVLEVDVTNLAANRIRDLDRRHVRWRIFHDINLVNIQYRPFDASNWPVFESGLLGPVTLMIDLGPPVE